MRISDWSSDVCSSDLFEEFANGKSVTPAGSFPRIPYRESMLKYGNDKPDLRNPLIITDVSLHFTGSGFGRFADIVAAGDVVRAIPAPSTAEKSRKFFDDMNSWAQGEGFAGLGYATRKGGERSEEHTSELQSLMRRSDAVFCFQKK